MALKIVLCLALLLFTSGVGYTFAAKYRKRKLFFRQLYEFNERFLRELNYAKRPVKEFISLYAYKGEFCELLEDYSSKLGEDNFFQDYFSKFTFLKVNEEKEITDFFHSLGKGDSESQKNMFTATLKVFSEHKTDSEKEYYKYADLYIKLGVLVGLAIIILII